MMNAMLVDARLLAEARSDFQWCVGAGLLDRSCAAWSDFLQGYLDMEARRIARARRSAQRASQRMRGAA